MTKYTFSINNSNINKTNNGCPFFNKCNKSTDYSKMLDDLIAADIKEKNPWLYGYDTYTTKNPGTINIKFTSPDTKSFDDLENAFIYGGKTYYYNSAYNFLKNLGTCINCPFKKDIKYKLSDGTYIKITDDYIHINDEMYFFNLMDDAFFLNLPPKEKKTICTIYTDSLKITIKK